MIHIVLVENCLSDPGRFYPEDAVALTDPPSLAMKSVNLVEAAFFSLAATNVFPFQV